MALPAADQAREGSPAPTEDEDRCSVCGRVLDRQDTLAWAAGTFAHLACARRAWRHLTLEDCPCD